MANYDQRGQRVQSQVNINVNAGSIPDFPKSWPLRSWNRLYHYVYMIFFLIGTLIIWIIAGWSSKTKFPVRYVWTLFLASIAGLTGLQDFSTTLNNRKNKIYNLQENDLKASQQSLEEASRLNLLESKISLLEETVRILYGKINDRDNSISQILTKLENDKRTVQSYLDPLIRKYDRRLYRAKRTIQVLFEEKTTVERDYESIQRSLRWLSEKYDVGSKLPTQKNASNLVQSLYRIILDNPDKIEKNRLTTLRSTYNLLQWLYLLTDSSQQPIFFNASGELLGYYFNEFEDGGEINVAGASIEHQLSSKKFTFYLTILVADKERNIFPAKMLLPRRMNRSDRI